MDAKITLLDSDLVFQRQDLISFIDYWKRVLNIEIGWHYDIDIVWLLDQLEALKVPKGSTIMDAGAGNGLIQFLLAAKGYHVLSVDFSPRRVPKEALKIFRIEQDQGTETIAEHRYQKLIDHNRSHLLGKIFRVNVFKPLWTLRKVKKVLSHELDPAYWKERLQSQTNYGTITYMQADFTNMDRVETGIVDALVSVSAIEHNDIEKVPKALREFERVLKPRAPMLVTTSASKDKEHYLESCQGWCFTAEKLRDLFEMQGTADNYENYDLFMKKLIRNQFIYSRIPQLYFESDDNGLPWGKYPPVYQPVGILKTVT